MFFTGIRNTKIIEFQSELENGYQVVTTTAKSDFSLPSSPKLNRNHESPETPIDSLYRKHEETLSRVQSHMNVKPARNESLQDILEFENRQMMIQKEYLESIGWVTKDYLLKQGIRDEKMAQEICDEIQEILVEEERAVS